ncbi:MAG: hypothetical protein K8S23_08190 [Candidatus Cloacimonetes bacterium]|nr:hypothetical protein [Candidatus Cloacimonadota bacterium]
MTFEQKRQNIIKALNMTGITSPNIALDKDTIPRKFPAAIVVLQGEKGKNVTSHRYCEFEYYLAIFLIADVNNSKDPDQDIIKLASAFKETYRKIIGNDISKIDYYPVRADSGRKVRIAKVYQVTE